jgi:hypothetical protein
MMEQAYENFEREEPHNIREEIGIIHASEILLCEPYELHKTRAELEHAVTVQQCVLCTKVRVPHSTNWLEFGKFDNVGVFVGIVKDGRQHRYYRSDHGVISDLATWSDSLRNPYVKLVVGFKSQHASTDIFLSPVPGVNGLLRYHSFTR